MPEWVSFGYEEYAKRLPRSWPIQLIELPLAKKGNNPSELMEQEAIAILSKIESNDYVIALERKGQNWATEDLVLELKDCERNGKSITLIIGGPEGLSQKVISRANKLWSLSKLTFPHPIVRIILIESLYRAWSIINHHPYHR